MARSKRALRRVFWAHLCFKKMIFWIQLRFSNLFFIDVACSYDKTVGRGSSQKILKMSIFSDSADRFLKNDTNFDVPEGSLPVAGPPGT